jgi:hypothetical protein
MHIATIGLVFVCAIFFVCAAASARPPEAPAKPERSSGPEVGRLRMRDRVVPLTRASLAEGGEASELKEAFATEIMADIDHEHRSTADARDTR